jgi:hypothetical protein
MAPATRAVPLRWNIESMRTLPVKWSADPFTEGCEPFLMISKVGSPSSNVHAVDTIRQRGQLVFPDRLITCRAA